MHAVHNVATVCAVKDRYRATPKHNAHDCWRRQREKKMLSFSGSIWNASLPFRLASSCMFACLHFNMHYQRHTNVHTKMSILCAEKLFLSNTRTHAHTHITHTLWTTTSYSTMAICWAYLSSISTQHWCTGFDPFDKKHVWGPQSNRAFDSRVRGLEAAEGEDADVANADSFVLSQRFSLEFEDNIEKKREFFWAPIDLKLCRVIRRRVHAT